MTLFDECDDRALIQKTLAGQVDCFASLMNRHLLPVRGHLCTILRNPQDQDDVMQEVMLKVWLHLADFRGECRFRSWLTRIAINEALMFYRRHHRHFGEMKELEYLPSREETPHGAAMRRETAKRVRGAIADLPRRHRQVLVLKDLKEFDLRETAALVGVTVPAIKSRIFRARVQLSAALRAISGRAPEADAPG